MTNYNLPSIRLLILFTALSVQNETFIGASPLRAQPFPEVRVQNAASDNQPAIDKMTRQGVMRPRASGAFAPAEPSTLGEFLVSIQTLFQIPQPEHAFEFTDVPPGSRYFVAVQAASPYLNRQAMCFGCALSSNLYPDQPLTRAQSIVTLVSILNARGVLPLLDAPHADEVLQGVQDARSLSPLARRLVSTAISGGILSLSPERLAGLSVVESRGNTARILERVQLKFQLPEVRPPAQGDNP